MPQVLLKPRRERWGIGIGVAREEVDAAFPFCWPWRRDRWGIGIGIGVARGGSRSNGGNFRLALWPWRRDSWGIGIGIGVARGGSRSNGGNFRLALWPRCRDRWWSAR